MRIVVVHGRYRSTAPSGENHVVDQEVAALRAAGHEVEVFTRDSDRIASWSLASKAALPARTLWNEPVRRELAALLSAFVPDVVHVHNTFPLLSGSVLHACADAGVPVVATLHNYKLSCASGDFFRDGAPCHDCTGTRGAPAVRHGCYRGSRVATLPVVAGTALHREGWRSLVSAYVMISHSQRRLLDGLDLPDERIFVKHNFVPPPPESGDATRSHRVAYVGRLDAAKGVAVLMRAWDAFREDHPSSSLRLAVVGGGPLAGEVGAWAGRHDSVDVCGLVSRPEAADLMAGSVATLVCSQWEETFGLVAIEAMAHGVAPLVPDHGSFPELVTDGHDGRHYAAGRPRALAGLLHEADTDPVRFATLGEHGRTTFERRFHPETNLSELMDVYAYAVAHPVRACRTACAGGARVGG